MLTPPPNFLAGHPRNASDGEDGAWGCDLVSSWIEEAVDIRLTQGTPSNH